MWFINLVWSLFILFLSSWDHDYRMESLSLMSMCIFFKDSCLWFILKGIEKEETIHLLYFIVMGLTGDKCKIRISHNHKYCSFHILNTIFHVNGSLICQKCGETGETCLNLCNDNRCPMSTALYPHLNIKMDTIKNKTKLSCKHQKLVAIQRWGRHRIGRPYSVSWDNVRSFLPLMRCPLAVLTSRDAICLTARSNLNGQLFF